MKLSGESLSSSPGVEANHELGELIVASELLVKRLLKQASVSVLAGLLMSSAVLAEDNTDGAGMGDDGGVSVGIDGGGLDAGVDPADGNGVGGEDGSDGGADGGTDDGSDGGADDGSDGDTDGGPDDGTDGGPDISIDDGATIGTEGPDDGGIVDGGIDEGGVEEGVEPGTNPECADCSGIPEVSIDPMEMGGVVNDIDGVTALADGVPRGTQPNERGHLTGGTGGRDAQRGHDGPSKLGAVWKDGKLVK